MATTNEMATMVFKAAPGKDFSAFKNDLQTFNILSAMDGARSLGTIAKEDFYDVKVLSEKVGQLVQMGLLVPVQGGGATSIKPDGLKYLQAELTKLVGPVAGMLLKDNAKKLGHDLSAFPASRAGELLEMVVKFIQNDSQALEFKQKVLSRIK